MTRRLRTAALALAAIACGQSGAEPPAPTPLAFEVFGSEPVPCAYGAAAGSGRYVFLTSICAARVTRVDRTRQSATVTAPVGRGPAHVALSPAGDVLYTTDQLDGTVTAVNAITGARIATIPIGGGRETYNLLVSRDGRRVYVTTSGTRLFVIDASTRRVVDSATVGARSNGLALHPTRPTLYVSSLADGIVVALDTRTLQETARFTLGGMPQRITVSPDGSTLFASNETTGFDRLDLASGAVSHLNLGGPAIGMAMRREGDFAYVALANQGLVRIVDLKAFAVSRTIQVGVDPRNLAVGDDGSVVLADQNGLAYLIGAFSAR